MDKIILVGTYMKGEREKYDKSNVCMLRQYMSFANG